MCYNGVKSVLFPSFFWADSKISAESVGMSRRNLQNNNNIEKRKKRKKVGFFDATEYGLEKCDEAVESESIDSCEIGQAVLSEDCVKRDKKRFLLASVIFLSVLAVLFISIKIISGLDFINESAY